MEEVSCIQCYDCPAAPHALRFGLPRGCTRRKSSRRLFGNLRRHEGPRRDRSRASRLLRPRPRCNPDRHASSRRPSPFPPNEHSGRRKRGGDAGSNRSSQSLRSAPALALCTRRKLLAGAQRWCSRRSCRWSAHGLPSSRQFKPSTPAARRGACEIADSQTFGGVPHCERSAREYGR